MSVGFRKSLFGFNCDDVIAYIENTHRDFSAKETLLNKKIGDLDSTLVNVNAQLEEIKAAKAKVDAQLKEYTDKYDEIERLSQNIGKLYLVAQSNAKTIMQNSAESQEMSRKEIERNLGCIDEAHESLNSLKSEIMQTSADFVSKVEALVASLNITREQITNNDSQNKELSEKFESLYAEMQK